jgi:archaemetzincin
MFVTDYTCRRVTIVFIPFLLLVIIAVVLLISCRENKQHPSTARQRIAPENRIWLQPVTGFPEKLIPELQRKLERYYQTTVVVAAPKELPERFITRIKSTRYRADSILQWLKRIKPKDADWAVALTHHDISTTKYDEQGDIMQPVSRYADWGVFGLGYMPGPACVVSIFRLKTGNTALLQERLHKVAIHEVGHNKGLPHCKNACVMQDAVEKLSTIDHEPDSLCTDCIKTLSANAKVGQN